MSSEVSAREGSRGMETTTGLPLCSLKRRARHEDSPSNANGRQLAALDRVVDGRSACVGDGGKLLNGHSLGQFLEGSPACQFWFLGSGHWWRPFCVAQSRRRTPSRERPKPFHREKDFGAQNRFQPERVLDE